VENRRGDTAASVPVENREAANSFGSDISTPVNDAVTVTYRRHQHIHNELLQATIKKILRTIE
jgi:hypothetical protein